MRKFTAALAAVVLFVVAGALLARGTAERPGTAARSLPPVPGAASGLARVRDKPDEHAVEVVLGPITVPANAEGFRPPVQLTQIARAGYIHGFDWYLTDARGRRLPASMLHHVNLVDPDARELFSNTARHVMAAGRETGEQQFTSLVGYPVKAGTRLLVVSMFSNERAQPLDSVSLHVRLHWVPGDRIVRPLRVFPFALDVMGPVGEKSFAVPPGRTVRSWEGSPAVDGRILALGGHLHDYATRLELRDVTTGEVLWSVAPDADNGRVRSVPRGMPWWRGGIALRREHRYRITVEYDNPTRQPAMHGGMGVIAGLVHAGAEWPAVRYDDVAYRTDLANIVNAPRHPGHMHMH